jgi:hypothetical protein
LVDAKHAGTLAWSWAEAAGELREIVCFVKSLDGRFVVVAPGEVVPFRNKVSKRAALVTERYSAVHASRRLSCDYSFVASLINLFPVEDSNWDWSTNGGFTIGYFQKSTRISHL